MRVKQHFRQLGTVHALGLHIYSHTAGSPTFHSELETLLVTTDNLPAELSIQFYHPPLPRIPEKYISQLSLFIVFVFDERYCPLVCACS